MNAASAAPQHTRRIGPLFLLVAALAGCAGDPPTATTEAGCGSVTGPTVHDGEDITVNTTWTKCGNPHIVRWGVTVGSTAGAPILTLDPGVVVRFERLPGNPTFITVGYGVQGSLVVNGTAAEPVVMQSDAASPARGDYLGLRLHSGAVNTRLTYLTMRDCGPATTYDDNACVFAQGNGDSRDIEPILQNVTVDGSASLGILFTGGAAFGAGSTALTVRNAASYPVSIQQEEAGSLPAGGTWVGNGRNYIQLTTAGGAQGNTVSRSQTWIDPGIPYVVGGDYSASDIVIGGNDGDAPAVLTLTPGSVFRMRPGSVLVVGISTTGGALVARGTPILPITFTADAATPVPGFWVGVQIFEHAAASTLFDHAVIEYGGAEHGVSPGDRADVLATVDLGAVIVNSVIRNSGGCGIARARLTWAVPPFTTDFTAGLGNTFTGNAMGPQCGPYSY